MKLYQIDEHGIGEASKMSLPSQIADRGLAVLVTEDEDGVFPDDFLLVPRSISRSMVEQIILALNNKGITRICVSVAASAHSETMNIDEIEAHLFEHAPESTSTAAFR